MIYVGFLAILLMNFSAIPQLVKVWRTKQVKDLNIWREVMLLVGCSLYLIYGIYRRDVVIMVSNAWASLMFISMIYLIKKYGKEVLSKMRKASVGKTKLV